MWGLSSERLKSVKPFKRLDVIIYALVFITVLSLFLFFVVFAKQGEYTSIQASINGEEVAKYTFATNNIEYDSDFVTVKTNDSQTIILLIDVDGKTNEVIIDKKDKTAFVKTANCSSQDCVYSKKITTFGESIICAPHKLVVKGAGNGISDPILG